MSGQSALEGLYCLLYTAQRRTKPIVGAFDCKQADTEWADECESIYSCSATECVATVGSRRSCRESRGEVPNTPHFGSWSQDQPQSAPHIAA